MNRALLRQRIDDSGYKMRYIAKQLGISYQAFSDKVTGKTDFKVSEVHRLQDVLSLSDRDMHNIFFADDVE